MQSSSNPSSLSLNNLTDVERFLDQKLPMNQLKLLTDAFVNKEPKNLFGHFTLAILAAMNSDHTAAQKSLQTALAASVPHQAYVYSPGFGFSDEKKSFAELCEKYHCNDLALSIYEKAILHLNMLSVRYSPNLEAPFSQGQGTSYKTYLRKNLFALYLAAGDAAIKLGKIAKAQELYTQATHWTSHPKLLGVFCNDLPAILSSELCPEPTALDFRLMLHIGISYLRSGKFDVAEKYFKKLVSRCSEQSLVDGANHKTFKLIKECSYYFLGTIDHIQGLYEKALQSFTQTGSLGMRYQQGLCYQALNRTEEAKQLLQDGWQKNNNPYTKLLYAQALQKMDTSLFAATHDDLRLLNPERISIEDHCYYMMAAQVFNPQRHVVLKDQLTHSALAPHILLPLALPEPFRQAFFDIILDANNWPTARLSYSQTYEITLIKEQYVELVKNKNLGLTDQQRFNLAMQALCPQTAVGRVMYVAQGYITSPSLHKGSLAQIATYLTAHISEIELTPSTVNGLLDTIKQDNYFLATLKRYYLPLHEFVLLIPQVNEYLQERSNLPEKNRIEQEKNRIEQEKIRLEQAKKQKQAAREALIYQHIRNQKQQDFKVMMDDEGRILSGKERDFYIEEACRQFYIEHEEKLKIGIEEFNRGNITSALENLEQANECYSADKKNHLWLALCYAAQNNYPEARKQISAPCIEEYRGEGDLKDFGKFFAEHGAYRLAFYVYQKLDEYMIPLQDEDILCAAKSAFALGKYVKADNDFNHLSNSPWMRIQRAFYLAKIDFNEGKYSIAEKVFIETLNRCEAYSGLATLEINYIKSQSLIHLGLIQGFLNLEKGKANFSYFDEALTIPTSNALVIAFYKAYVLFESKNLEAAEKQFSEIWNDKNSPKSMLRLLSLIYLHKLEKVRQQTVYKKELENYLVSNQPPEDLSAPAACIWAMAYAADGNIMAVKRLLQNSAISPQILLPGELPVYLRPAYLQLILNNKFWVTGSILNTDVHELKAMKEGYKDWFVRDKNFDLGVQALLCPYTSLGYLFEIARGSTYISITSGTKKELAECMEKELANIKTSGQKIKLSSSTRAALIHAVDHDANLVASLSRYPHIQNLVVQCKAQAKKTTAPSETVSQKALQALSVPFKNNFVTFDLKLITDYFARDTSPLEANDPIRSAGLALCYATEGSYEKARAIFNKVIHDNQQVEVDLLRTCAEFYLKCGNARLACYAFSSFNLSEESDYYSASLVNLQLGASVKEVEYLQRDGRFSKAYQQALAQFENNSMLEALVGFEQVLAACKSEPKDLVLETKAHLYIAFALILAPQANESLERALMHLNQAEALDKPLSLTSRAGSFKALALQKLSRNAEAEAEWLQIVNSEEPIFPSKLFATYNLCKLDKNYMPHLETYLSSCDISTCHSVENACIAVMGLSLAIENNPLFTQNWKLKVFLEESRIAPHILLPSEIPVYLRADYFKLLSDGKWFPENFTLDPQKADLKFLKQIKEQYVAEFVRSKDINLAIQALCVATPIGQVFNMARITGTPSLAKPTNSNAKMAAALNKFLWDNPTPPPLSESTKAALKLQLNYLLTFVGTIKTHFPALHEFIRNTFYKTPSSMFFLQAPAPVSPPSGTSDKSKPFGPGYGNL